jgi:hypothetical protein
MQDTRFAYLQSRTYVSTSRPFSSRTTSVPVAVSTFIFLPTHTPWISWTFKPSSGKILSSLWFFQSEENGPDFSKRFDPGLTKEIAIRRSRAGAPKTTLQSVTIARDKARNGMPKVIVRVKVDKRQPRELVRAEVEVMGNIWRRRLGYGCPWTLQFTVR